MTPAGAAARSAPAAGFAPRPRLTGGRGVNDTAPMADPATEPAAAPAPQPLLFRVLHAEKAKSTHHKLALDALTHLTGEHAARWRNLFLRQVEPYFTGAKAPDKSFKDFSNHVLHVRDGLWGGAPAKVREWYGITVERLSARDWPAAAYAAGVLSHYYTDPQMPFHTGQSEAEKRIHRAAEWSCTKSYDRFKTALNGPLGWPAAAVPEGADWLERMTIDGAARANEFYDELCDRYDFAAGVKNPPAGLDEVCRRELALCCGHAATGFARILDRAFADSGQAPPRVGVSLVGFLTAFTKPIFWLTRKLHDRADRAEVLRIWKELQRTGDVVKHLPAESRAVREAFLKSEAGGERLKVESGRVKVEREGAAPAPPADPPRPRPRMIAAVPTPEPTPAPRTFHPAPSTSNPARSTPDPAPSAPDPTPSAPPPAPVAVSLPPSADPGAAGERTTFRLHPADPIVDAPGIGPKTAARFQKIGVEHVTDLLAGDPHDLADRLDTRWIVPEIVRDWQDQAALMCRVPNLHGHDVQILVAVGVTDPADLPGLTAEDLLGLTEPLVNTSEGSRILRGSSPPDLAEVTDWIAWARQARPMPRRRVRRRRPPRRGGLKNRDRQGVGRGTGTATVREPAGRFGGRLEPRPSGSRLFPPRRSRLPDGRGSIPPAPAAAVIAA